METKQTARRKITIEVLKGINIRHNLCVERPHTLIGEIKCIYPYLNDPGTEPILVLIVRNLGTLAYARARHRDFISKVPLEE